MRARFAAAALVLAACDASWKAEGYVVDDVGTPVEGARVAVVCEEDTLDTEVTTAAGRFEVGGAGGAGRALGCGVEISKPGLMKKSFHMTDLCFRSAKTQNYHLPCGASEGRVALDRR